MGPTDSPTASPTYAPTDSPTASPTYAPTESPTASPTYAPTQSPTASPTYAPTQSPTTSPTQGTCMIPDVLYNGGGEGLNGFKVGQPFNFTFDAGYALATGVQLPFRNTGQNTTAVAGLYDSNPDGTINSRLAVSLEQFVPGTFTVV